MIELLAPCGGMEQLRAAIKYGADAVYMGTKQFSLRAHADHAQDIRVAVDYAHEHGVRIYITMNAVIFPHQIDEAKQLIQEIVSAGADAIIISDPGLIGLIKEISPGMEIHLSTQASTSNPLSATFWRNNGVKRIVLSRECTLADVAQIRKQTPGDLEFEAFCHGAMCVAYSGRCLLSAYFTGRSANCGDCSQPCRWEYQLTEKNRPNDGLTVEEDEQGTYLLSSRDLNMIEHLPEMIDAGITSLKIEGRMKTAFYVGTLVRAYRMALDALAAGKPLPQEAVDETYKASHRRYTTGFYFGDPLEQGQQYDSNAYIRQSEFVGVVLSYDALRRRVLLEQRGKFLLGDTLEILCEDGTLKKILVQHLEDESQVPVASAPHPQQRLWMDCDFVVSPGDLIRKDKE